MAIATLAQLKEFLGIVDTDEDAVLTYLLNAANSQVAKYIGYDPESQVVIETRDGNGRYALVLAHPHPLAVSGVKIDGVDVPMRADPTGSGWFFDASRNMLWVCGSWSFNKGVGNIEVTYTAGYNPMEPALTQGVLDLVAVRREELKRRGISSKSLAGETVSFVYAAVPETIRGYLDPFRKVIWP